MNKEYFKILKEISSLENNIDILTAKIQAENQRVDKLVERQDLASEEREALQGELKAKRLESQKNEGQIATLDGKHQKIKADINSSFDPKHAQALENERESLTTQLAELEDAGFLILEEMDALEEQIAAKSEFLSGIGETIQEIKSEVDESCAGFIKELESKRQRVAASLNELPKNFQESYEKVKTKNLSISNFTKIQSGTCAVCKTSVDKSKQSQIEDQLALKTCSSCSRIFIPNQALY